MVVVSKRLFVNDNHEIKDNYKLIKIVNVPNRYKLSPIEDEIVRSNTLPSIKVNRITIKNDQINIYVISYLRVE